MKKKILVGLFLLIGLSLLVMGCGGNSQSTSQQDNKQESTQQPKKIVIGFSQVTLDSPFYVSLMDAAKAEAANKGAELIYVDAQNDIKKQNADVQDLITKGINVLILNPSNPSGVNPALDAAKKANIPVVTVDRPTETKVATFVGRDNKKMGELAGEQAVALLGGKGKAKGKIIELQGDAGGKVMMDRRDGFHLAVDKEPGIKVVQGPYCDYTRSKAVKAFQDLLQANPDVKLVYAHNDDMALGALQVLQQNSLAGKVKIVGVDGLIEAIKAIQDGKYDATVLNDPQLLGTTVVDTALGVLNGENYPDFIDAGTGLITKENAAQYYNDKLVFAAAK